MNLQTTTHAVFQTGVAGPMAGGSAIPGLTEPGARGHANGRPKGLGKNADRASHESPELRPETEMVEDAGLGAMTGLGVAMIFNAGLALAGLVGWEIWTMLH